MAGVGLGLSAGALPITVLGLTGEPKRLLHREAPSRCDRGLGC